MLNYMNTKKYDWTAKDGVSNSSEEYLRLVDIVERLIREDAHVLINGNVRETARLIMSQLAHKHNVGPLE